MKFIGLLSGGKDSMFAVGKAMSMGHEIVCAANLYSNEEADSFMFQTCGTPLLPAIAEALGIPLIHRELKGKSSCKTMTYTVTEKDEVEDLYELLLEAKYQFPEVQAVVSGAVFSDYQRIRVEHVCSRLGLSSISPLWRHNQKDLLQEMHSEGYKSTIIKISSMGLQEKHLGSDTTSQIDYFDSLNKKFGFNVAGEGGEYETLILDAPIMKKRLILGSTEKVLTGNSAYSPYGHLLIKKLSIEDKSTGITQEYTEKIKPNLQIFKRHGEIFTGEVTAKGLGVETTNFEHEVFMVIKGIKEKLESEGLGLGNVYYLTAYIKNMQDFAKFNSVYSKFFGFPNPPSRVCVELASQDCGIKIALKGTLSTKKCTHVQSISNWAPASIGPYSQSYLIGSALHLAGSIPLVGETMTLSDDSVNQCLNNCEAVAKVNDFSLNHCQVCIVYYTGEKLPVPAEFFPFYVHVSGLPRAAPVELEMHLQKNMPQVHQLIENYNNETWSGRILKKHCTDLIHLSWFVEIDSVFSPESLISFLQSELSTWFDSVAHKSGVNKEQLLGSQPIIVNFQSYINEIRVYSPTPSLFQHSWFLSAPTVYLDSSTTSIFIHLQDFLQITTYQFINSGN